MPLEKTVSDMVRTNDAAQVVVIDTASGKRVTGCASLRALSHSLMRLGDLLVDEVLSAGGTAFLFCSRA